MVSPSGMKQTKKEHHNNYMYSIAELCTFISENSSLCSIQLCHVIHPGLTSVLSNMSMANTCIVSPPTAPDGCSSRANLENAFSEALLKAAFMALPPAYVEAPAHVEVPAYVERQGQHHTQQNTAFLNLT